MDTQEKKARSPRPDITLPVPISRDAVGMQLLAMRAHTAGATGPTSRDRQERVDAVTRHPIPPPFSSSSGR